MTRSSRLAGVRVLAVDDEPDTLEVVALSLEDAGAAVKVATTVAEAARLFESFAPHAIVTDLAMPQVSGFDLFRELQEWQAQPGPAVPVLLLTAHSRPDLVRDAKGRGFAAVLAKPADPDALVAAVAQALGR